MNLFKLLSDNTKFEIIKFLIDKKCCDCICRIQDALKKDHSVILKDVQQLENAGLIWTKKKGKFLCCGINNRSRIINLINIAEEIGNGKGKEKRISDKVNG